MLKLILTYAITIATCISFFVFTNVGRMVLSGEVSRYFTVGTFMVLAVVISEVFEQYYSSPDFDVNWQRWVFSILGYILRPGIAFVLLLVPLRGYKKYSYILVLPLALDVLFLLISPFCGIVFSFDSNNRFEGGPLRFIPFVVSGIYLASLLVVSYIRSKRCYTSEFVASTFIVLTCCLAIYLESEHNLLGSLPQAIIVGIIFYYIYFCTENYNKDILTGAYNRNKFHHDTDIAGFKFFIIFDINGLKLINDNRGHIVGDLAIQSFARQTLHVLPPRANLYRIGGDEMGIIYRGATEDDVKNLLEKIKQSMKEDDVPYGFSYGYASYISADEFNSAYKIADDMMYESKNAYWADYRQKHSVSKK